MIFIYPFLLLCAWSSLSSGERVGEQRIEQVSITEIIRTSCSLDSSEDTYFSWNGTIFNVEPGKPQETLFRLSGFNVGRCYKVEELGNLWFKSAREMMVYLDKDDGTLIDKWTNPNGYEVPVMHIANNPATFVLGRDGGEVGVYVGGEFATFVTNVPLFYPDPVYANPETRSFSDFENYQAMEIFQWFVNAEDLNYPDSSKTGRSAEKGRSSKRIDDVTTSWARSIPYPPWMNMTNEGKLFFSATATRVHSFDDLFPVLKKVVKERAPIFETAPDCVLANPRIGEPGVPPWATVTSRSYFVENFQAYLDGATFPIFQDEEVLQCVEDALGN